MLQLFKVSNIKTKGKGKMYPPKGLPKTLTKAEVLATVNRQRLDVKVIGLCMSCGEEQVIGIVDVLWVGIWARQGPITEDYLKSLVWRPKISEQANSVQCRHCGKDSVYHCDDILIAFC